MLLRQTTALGVIHEAEDQAQRHGNERPLTGARGSTAAKVWRRTSVGSNLGNVRQRRHCATGHIPFNTNTLKSQAARVPGKFWCMV